MTSEPVSESGSEVRTGLSVIDRVMIAIVTVTLLTTCLLISAPRGTKTGYQDWRFESILLRIYGADDVSSLLDIVPDIRDVVQAGSVSVYIMEENEVIGRYLKPLVWDNAFLIHSDFSKYIAPLESHDFAASVARFWLGILAAVWLGALFGVWRIARSEG